MTDLEMIKQMAKMQKTLDKEIMEKSKECKKPMNEYDVERVMLALIDEIGELVHELKGDWCWWKKTQAPVNEERTLEELVDVWHFALSLNNYFDYICELDDFPNNATDNTRTIVDEIIDVIASTASYENMITFTFKLNFTIEEVYYAYIEKNKENYERIERGY